MSDQRSGDDAASPSEPPIIPLWPWGVAKIKRKLHERRAERKNETSQDRFARRTANATVAIAVLAIVAATLGTMQWLVMQGQLEAMQADQRPWIAIDLVALSGPLSYDDSIPKSTIKEDVSRWHINVVYEINNVGKTPGVDFGIAGLLFPRVFPDETNILPERDAMKLACSMPFFGAIIGFGQEDVIFPGQKPIQRELLVVATDETFDASKMSKFVGDFLIVVCGSYYTSGTSRKEHHTGRIYALRKKSGAPMDLKGETLPFSQLEFEPSPVHSSFAD